MDEEMDTPPPLTNRPTPQYTHPITTQEDGPNSPTPAIAPSPTTPSLDAANATTNNGTAAGYKGTRADFRRAVNERLVPALRSFNPKVCM